MVFIILQGCFPCANVQMVRMVHTMELETIGQELAHLNYDEKARGSSCRSRRHRKTCINCVCNNDPL